MFVPPDLFFLLRASYFLFPITLKMTENFIIPIHETFQKTIQGEGYWAGTPVDFIRLAGCSVGCH